MLAHNDTVYLIELSPIRERTQQLASETSTETHLAELYAQVQAMPESAQKRRLISKLNDANGHGTPHSPLIQETII